MKLRGTPGSKVNIQYSSKGNEAETQEVWVFACVKEANCFSKCKNEGSQVYFTQKKQVWLGFILVSTHHNSLIMILYTFVWLPGLVNWSARWSKRIAISSSGTQLLHWLSPRDWCGYAQACPVQSIKCHLYAMSAWWMTPQDPNYRDEMMNTTPTMDKIIGIRA